MRGRGRGGAEGGVGGEGGDGAGGGGGVQKFQKCDDVIYEWSLKELNNKDKNLLTHCG